MTGRCPSSGGSQLPRQGDWALKVWFEDQAGNVAEANAGQVHLHYGRDPRAAAALRLSSFVRRGARLVVRGSLAKGATGQGRRARAAGAEAAGPAASREAGRDQLGGVGSPRR